MLSLRRLPTRNAVPTPQSRRPYPRPAPDRVPGNALATALTPQDVRLDVCAGTKREALCEAAHFIAERYGFDEIKVHARLEARERVGSTGLGYGIAIPHARIKNVVAPIAFFVRTRSPIPFDAPDAQAVTDMLVFLVPEQATDAHLSLLAEAARVFSDEAIRAALLRCNDPESVHALLTGRSASVADPVAREAERSMDQAIRWLCPPTIALDVDVGDNVEALQSASGLIERAHGVAAAPIFRALWRREQAASTAVGNGFAIPHARVEGIKEPLTLYARTKKPIPFRAPDGRPVSELFFIVIPAQGANAEHLKLLSLVAEAFSNEVFRKRLNEACDPACVQGEFKRWIAERISAAQH